MLPFYYEGTSFSFPFRFTEYPRVSPDRPVSGARVVRDETVCLSGPYIHCGSE